MKTSRSLAILFSFGAAAVLSFAALSAPAADKTPAAKTPAEPAPVPRSVFTIPTAAGIARDPFNPSRIIQAEVQKPLAATNTVHPTSLSCLVLKGLSGAPTAPLAMINGRTMARGEDAEINTDCGRLLVHCVDITTNSAIVEVAGERRELRLRSDF